MKKCFVFALCGALSAAALAATVTLDGETEYAVASGVTNTVADTLTGSGSIRKTGTGQLTLSGTGNDFTGGVVVEAGTVQANAAEAFGAGTIEVANRDAKACFNVAPATSGDYTLFPNALSFTGSQDVGLSGTQGDGRYNVIFYQNTHLTNTISGTRSFRLRHNPKNTGDPRNGGPSTIFDGPLSVASGKTIYLNVYGSMIINGPITASTLYGGESWSGGGHLYLNNPANAISQMIIALNRVHCGDTNVVRGAEVVWRSPGGGKDDTAYLDLDGHDQTVAALRRWTFSASSGWTSYLKDSGNFYCVKTANSKPATLTITGLGSDCISYETLRGPVSLVLDAQNYPSFKQTFANHPSPFTGTTTVRAGTLELTANARFTAMPSLTVETGGTFVTASTNALPSLEKVTNLVVRGTFDASTARVNPFGVTLANLEIDAGATLKMPTGSQLFTKSLTMGGQTFTSGRFTAETLATLSGATIANVTVLVVGNAAEVAWTGAVSEALTTLGNWDPAPVAASDFTYGQLSPLFASAGVRAVVDADAAFSGLTFRAAEGQTGFALARDAAENAHGLTLYNGRVAACSNDAALTEHTYVIDAPVALDGPVTFHADKNQTLILSNAFCDTALGNGDRMLTIDGTGISAHTNFGRVVFAGTNYFGGPIVSTTSLWRVSGKLANPGDAYTGNPLNDTSAAILLRFGSAGFTSSSDSYGIELDNAKIGKSIMVNNVMGVRTLTALANTTNEISGFLCYNPATSNHQGVAINSNAEIILSGGLYASHSFRIYKGGTLRIKDTPINCPCSAGFNPAVGKAIFEVAGNSFVYMLQGYSGWSGNTTVDMMVNHVMTNGVVEVGGDGGNAGKAKDVSSGTHTLDIHCTTQRCAYVAVRKRGILKGEYPAMLEVYEGRPNILSKTNYVVIGKVEGGVGFNLCGPGDLVFTNQAFTSCGDLVVSNGRMEFASNATWLNGTNVTVTGTGTLKLAAGARFDGKKAVLHLGADADTWQIDIPAGQTQVFSYAYDADGKLLPSGDYGNVASGAAQTREACPR